MPRKSQSANIVSASGDANQNNSSELIQQLLKQIEDLKNQVEAVSEKKIVCASVPKEQSYESDVDTDEFNKNKIAQDDYIKVISLCPYQLNLSTESKGRGRVYPFFTFGSTKRILYSELVKILENHHNFVEDFLFYIMDKRVIRRHGLDELYSKALTKEKIEVIINGNSEDAVSLYKSANKSQQDVIVSLLMDKLIKDPDSVDLNLVDKISRASGTKIQEKAEEARSLMEILANPEEGDVKQVNK